jgi:hypothetical protein
LLLLDAEDAATTRTVVEVAAEIIFIMYYCACVFASAEYEDTDREKNFAFFSSMREKDTRGFRV